MKHTYSILVQFCIYIILQIIRKQVACFSIMCDYYYAYIDFACLVMGLKRNSIK